MRFLLDENVDARVRNPITDQGHDCWTVPEANLAGEEDPNLSVYAHSQEAVLVTHDRAFSLKARAHIFGHHVHLKCHALEAVDVVTLRLEDLVTVLSRHQDLYAAVAREGIEFAYPNQGW